MSDDERLGERFLVVAPTGKDARLTCELLSGAGLEAVACSSVAVMCEEARRGAAALLIAEEALTTAATRDLLALLAVQETWSDLPILLFTGAGTAIHAHRPMPEQLVPLGNITLLDRPVRPVTMISSARAALRARRRQYEARAELERQQVAVRQRDEFLAMLGHELRNPLSGILLAGEQLERGNGDAERSRAVIARQGRVLTRLVDDLLDVARVTTGKIVLQREPLELNELIARCASNARTGLDQRGSTIAVERSPGRLLVDGDPVRLEQVFGNLIRNAIKYSDGRANIQISIEQRDDRAVVRVRDHGIGMAPEIIHRVFDLFCQAERALDRAEGGLGIGLTLVKSLVELHGGTVRAASAGLGAGSEFTVELPLGSEARATAPVAHGQDRAAQRPLHILVIEDNTDTRELLRSLFESWQHQVEVASDGLEGVERASRLHPDAVIVDLGLPVIDGLEVARRLRDQFGQDLLLVAVTGYGQLEDKRRSYEAGFDAHFTKPLDVRQLRELLTARFASPDLGVC